MSAGTIDIQVPDIGDFKDVAVIEVLVKPCLLYTSPSPRDS